MPIPIALTIAGSDSGGGAGIQADMKTFYSMGVYGACAITSVTFQNTLEVRGRYDLPAEVVASQMEAVLSDLEVGAVKTGMLANAEVVRAVAEVLSGYGVDRLVVDPVAFSSSGQSLLDQGGLQVIADELLPYSMIFTPNLAEASAFLGREILDVEGMKKAARSLREMGPGCVVIKGGHLEVGPEVVDIFFDGKDMVELALPRVETSNDHGTGCVFSAAITARLAKGEIPLNAVIQSKQDVARALENSLHIGGGSGPVNPLPEDWSE